MKVYTYSQARQRLSEVLDTALREEVLIRRKGRETFSLVYKSTRESPFDVPGIQTRASTQDIVDAVRESRSGGVEPDASDSTPDRR